MTTSWQDEGATRFGLVGATAGVDSAFNDRVRLFVQVSTFINCGMTAVGVVLWRAGLDPQLAAHGRVLTIQMALVTAVTGLVWFVMARGRLGSTAAVVTQGLVTLLLIGNYASVVFRAGRPGAPETIVFVLLVSTVVLVLRSALVPSPTVATVVVGVLSIATATVFSPGLDAFSIPVLAWSGLLSLVVIAVTALTSHTIYGLEQRMRATARLGQYQIDRLLGEGSMGQVYLATHALLNRPTAVKLLRDAGSAAARDRFRREVQAASGLSHPNTIEIYDYGRTAEGVFYFAMEYVEGATLDEAVTTTGPMPPARVVYLLLQAAGSLAEAHARGLVHRDIKPANLMLCERGGRPDTLKVLDFGLVRDVAQELPSERGGLTGTPLYLAPEAVADDEAFSPESDVYALGATAYFLLTGRPPFSEGSLVEVLSDHLVTPPPPIEIADARLADLVLRCLAKEPAARPPDAHAVIDALEGCDSYGQWKERDARGWWDEHHDIVEASRGGTAPRVQTRISTRGPAAAQAASA